MAACLVSLYTQGDTLPLYSRISSLQQYLSSKESFSQSIPKQPCLGCLECLAALSISLSNQIVSSLPQTLAVAVKQVSRYAVNVSVLHADYLCLPVASNHACTPCRNADPVIQCMALRLAAAVVGGLGGADALKAVDKCLKDKSSSTPIKIAAAAVIKAVAEAGGAGLWANAGSVFDDTAHTCVLGLADPSLTVREAFAAALGEVAAASNAPSVKEAVCPLTLSTCATPASAKHAKHAWDGQCILAPVAQAS